MKKWWKSKTIIVNIVSGFLLVAGDAAKWEFLSQYHSQITQAIVIANIVLRFVTNTSIGK